VRIISATYMREVCRSSRFASSLTYHVGLRFILPNDDEDAVRSKYDLEVDYGDYFSGGPSQGPLKTKTTGRKRAILFTSDSTKHNWTWSRDNKAHFICHSQGGTTVRLLISLMAHGDDRQKAYFGKKRGRDDWAISVITIGTPHKGTTITDVITKLFSVGGVSRVFLLAHSSLVSPIRLTDDGFLHCFTSRSNKG